MLVQEAEKRLKEQSAKIVRLFVKEKEIENLKPFYDKLGYETSSTPMYMIMHKEL